MIREKLGEYYSHKDLVRHLVIRDFKSRYMGSSLGSLWSVINPLVMILIYTIIFSKLMGAKLQLPGMTGGYVYSVYLCAGLLPWVSFADTVSRSTNIFIENSHLVKKVAFPKMVLLAYVNIVGIINFMISLSLFTIFLILIGHYPSKHFLFLPIVYGLQLLLTFGLGMGLSCLNVYFRDVSQLVGILLQIFFWATPIVYVVDIIPARIVLFMKFNPMYHLMDMYHDVILYRRPPGTVGFAVFAAVALLSCVGGYFIFRNSVADIVDEI